MNRMSMSSDILVNGVPLRRVVNGAINRTERLEAKIRDQQRQIDDLTRRIDQIDAYLEDCAYRGYPDNIGEYRMVRTRSDGWVTVG